MSNWVQQQKIEELLTGFGQSVSIYDDTTIVGAHLDNTGITEAGAAYIYTVSGTTWALEQMVQASDIATGDQFGFSVAIYDDTAVVGAQGKDTGATDAGAVYIFTVSGTTWTQQQKIQASDRAANDYFGTSVAIYEDTVVIGARGKNTGGTYAGAAYVFTRSGTTWTQQQKIAASDIEPFDYFGKGVSIYNDTVIVGAPYEDSGGTNAGAAYVFTRSGTTWTEQQKIISSDIGDDDQFGHSLAIYADTAVVGARYESTGGMDAGAAYIFTRSGTTWTQAQKICASDIAAEDYFGFSVDIYGDTVIAGSYWNDAGAANTGAAYIYTLSGTTWIEEQKIQASPYSSGDRFGYTVSIFNNRSVVSNKRESVYTFYNNAVYAVINDSFVVDDSNDVTVSGLCTVSGSILMGDSNDVTVSGLCTVSGSLVIGDSMGATYSGTSTVSDSMLLSDNTSSTYSGTSTVSDSLVLDDRVTGGFNTTVTVSGSIILSDTLLPGYIITADTSDSIALSSTSTSSRLYYNTATDSFDIGDSISGTVSAFPVITDSIIFSDNIDSTYSGTVSVTDTMILSETPRYEQRFYESISDSISINDFVYGGNAVTSNVAASFSVSDSTSSEVVDINTDIQKPSVGVLINLYSIDLSPITNDSDDLYYFTDSPTSLGTAPVWGGNTYTPIPMELEGTEFDGKSLPRPTLRVGNTNSAASELFIGWIISYEDMVGATVTRIRTLEKYLDGSPTANSGAQMLPELYTVSQKMAQTKTSIEWELTGYMDMVGIHLPRRQVLKNTCTHTYRIWDATANGGAGAFDYTKSTCPYQGVYIFKSTGEYTTNNADDQCGKRLSDCKLRYIDTTHAINITPAAVPPAGHDNLDLWLDMSSIPADWKLWNGESWNGTPKFISLPTRAFPGVAQRGR